MRISPTHLGQAEQNEGRPVKFLYDKRVLIKLKGAFYRTLEPSNTPWVVVRGSQEVSGTGCRVTEMRMLRDERGLRERDRIRNEDIRKSLECQVLGDALWFSLVM